MGEVRVNRSNKPKPEANRSARDGTESHQRPKLCAWNPFSGKLKPTCFRPLWRRWRKSEKKSSSSKEASPELPPEIIREILIRLPTKSIGRSRCVSKLFRSLSSDPGFAKSHLDLTVPPVHRILIKSSGNMYSSDLDSIGGTGSKVTRDLVAVDLNYPLEHEPGRRNWVEILGSSHGLVCISPDKGVVFLFNPTTGDSKRLPESTDTKPSMYQSYGFGFDHLTNDYKVVKLVADSYNILYACVYSLKTDSWRWVRDLNYQHSNIIRSDVNLNGVHHWMFTRKEGKHRERVILAFDFITQEFREMPCSDEAEYSPVSVVGNLNGRLCVFNRIYGLGNDIWVMNEYGVASSWTRIRLSMVYRNMKPVCSTKNSEEVLLVLDGYMVLYNLETDACRKLEIQGVKLSEGFNASMYVESLISPNSYGSDN